jgi:HEAT repeat protein
VKRRRLVLLGILLATGLGMALLVPGWRARLVRFVYDDRDRHTFNGQPTSHWVRALREDTVTALLQLGAGGAPAVPVLLEACRDEDSLVRSWAALALDRIAREDPAALPVFLAALKEEDASVRAAAAGVLVQAIRTARGLERKFLTRPGLAVASAGGLFTPTRTKRAEDTARDGRAGAKILPPDEAVLPALLEALRDPEPIVRARVASALGDLGPEARDAVYPLVEALRDPDSSVRNSAASALGQIGPAARPAMPSLLEMLRDEELRGYAAYALVQMGPEARDAVPALVDLLRSDDLAGRQLAMGTLGGIGPDAAPAVPVLLEMFKDTQDPLRLAVARALRGIGPAAQAAVPTLLAALGDAEPALASAIRDALSEIDPRALQSVRASAVAGLSSKDYAERVRSARKLRQADPDAAAKLGVPALVAGLAAADRERRILLLAGLGSLAPTATTAVPVLLEALKDPDAGVRKAAVEALAGFAASSPQATAALEQARNDPAQEVRQAARRALRGQETGQRGRTGAA